MLVNRAPDTQKDNMNYWAFENNRLVVYAQQK